MQPVTCVWQAPPSTDRPSMQAKQGPSAPTPSPQTVELHALAQGDPLSQAQLSVFESKSSAPDWYTPPQQT